MSRIGQLPIELPKGVEVTIKGQNISVKGPKGTLNLDVKDGISMAVEDGVLRFSINEGVDDFSKFQGLYRSLANNMVIGVTDGFKKELEMIGVGFRAAVQGNLLDLSLGFSHPTKMPIPEGISVNVVKNTNITLEGADKQALGEYAAQIRRHRPPEPYKGKGIRYKGEHVRRKAGKTGKGG